MTPAEILKSETLIANIAAAVEYNVINSGDCLMLHLKDAHFSLAPAPKIAGKKHQGYIECVSSDTLESLVGLGETSNDGLKEAAIIAEWMKSQK